MGMFDSFGSASPSRRQMVGVRSGIARSLSGQEAKARAARVKLAEARATAKRTGLKDDYLAVRHYEQNLSVHEANIRDMRRVLSK
jgi:hypothetical protein